MKRLNIIYCNMIVLAAVFFAFRHSLVEAEQAPLVRRPALINNKIVNLGYDCRYLYNLTQQVTPENTIFAFDLHEVLFNRSRSRIAWSGFKLFCKSFFYMLFHPGFVCRLINIACEPMVCEGMFVKLAEEYPYIQCWEEDFYEIANDCCYPKESMINLLKILKAKGFKVFLLSNIGSRALADFRKKFTCIEGLFDGFYTPCQMNNYCCKPMGEFYQGFKGYLRSKGYGNKQILFIDDLEKNIKGACEAGISGIRFIGYEKLCNTLRKLGISISNQQYVMLKK